MLTSTQIKETAKELQANYQELSPDKERILSDLGFTEEVLEDALHLAEKKIASPTQVWMLRDYLEEKIKESGKRYYPFSVLKTNIWYGYEKPW